MKRLSLLLLFLLSVVHLSAQIGSAKEPLYCGDNNLLNDALDNDVYLQKRIADQDQVLRTAISNIDPLSFAVVTIPVVVHVVSDPGNSATNISDQQVIDQIAALNNEFNVVNSTNIYFCLAQVLPDQTTNWSPLNGTGTAGITRTSDANISNHSMDFEQGLLNSVAVGFDPARYMNIWVVENISSVSISNVLGYAPKPIIPTSMLDGVVIRYDVFGDNTYCSCYSLFGNYQQGKVLVHETGHYLGLYHPFQRGIYDADPACQNTSCGTVDGDLCCDTPPCWSSVSGWNGATYGCPSSNLNSCTSTNADDNYMEYTDDPCKSIFTSDQAVRMQATIAALRSVLVSPENLVYTGVGSQCGSITAALVPDFYSPETEVCTGGTMTFTPVSSNNTATTYAWTFAGGSPSSSSSSSPVTVTYSSPGIYTVTLTVDDGGTPVSSSQTIYVADCSVNDLTQSNWYFGDHASLLFTASALPTSPWAPPSSMYSTEACASISDNSGNALFYTNGQQAYEAVTHTVNSGGTMNGSPNSPSGFAKASATQGAVSFPDPNNPSDYYIFTVADMGSTQNPLSYSILNSSNAITTLNQPAQTGGPATTEHLAAIPDCDDQGYWVITHGLNSPFNDKLLAYHVTAAGVNSTPVTSSSYAVTASSADQYGQIDVSRDGSRLAFITGSGVVELYDFDRATGSCTLVTTLPAAASMYGGCFSPNGKLFYTLGAGVNAVDLIQWDLSDWACGNLPMETHINSYSFYGRNNTLQLGPDDRIYVTSTYVNNSNNRLAMINFPDVSGTACGFNVDALSMIQQTPRFGLPNMVDAQHNPTPEIRYCVSNCAFHFYSTGCGTTYAWDFGDGGTSSAASPTYTYTATGTYTVSLTIDANTVTPIVVNATGAPAIFAINYNTPKEFVRIDPTNGSETQTILYLTNFTNPINGSSTFDPNHNYFIFSGLSSSPMALNHYVIDVTTGNITITPLAQTNIDYEYDVSLNKLFGIDNGASPREVDEFDPLTGAYIRTIYTLPSGRTPVQASSTYDQANHTYIFRAYTIFVGGYHYAVDVVNSTATVTTISTSIATELECNQAGTVYGYAPANPTTPTIEELNSSGDYSSTAATLTGLSNIYYGCSTFDPANNTFYLSGGGSGGNHYVIDCTGGTFSAFTQTTAYAEYQYASCAPTCLSCRYANPNPPQAQQPASAEFVSSQPNPSDQQTTFNYHVVADGQVTLEIYDVSGKLVARPVAGINQVAGDYQLQWDSSQLQSGIYYCRLTTASGQSNSKMVIAR